MYRDLTHPVKQAVLELQHGLALLANSACPDQSGWVNLAVRLAEFPARQGASSYCQAPDMMHGIKQDPSGPPLHALFHSVQIFPAGCPNSHNAGLQQTCMT